MSTRPIPYLFPTHSRLDSPNAPAFDPSLPVKTWADPSPASDPISYNFLDAAYKVQQMAPMTAAHAKALNLPGHPPYPQAPPAAPTPATFNGGHFPYGVSSREEAESLAKELNLPVTAIADAMDGFKGSFPIDYKGDTRRAFTINGQLVATLLKQKYANGIGAPGHWDTVGPITWVSEVQPDLPVTGLPLAVPVGPIDPSEKVIGVGPLATEMVLMKDDAPTAAAPATGDLNEVLQILRALKTKFLLD